ncbi:MAG: helix-turn-helix domain-containing protein [Planctomycetota bacterium]|jgi:hypothetical protein
MADMFYSVQKAAEKLNMTEEQVKELIKEGKLREFNDRGNILCKADEVEALVTSGLAEQPQPASAESELVIDTDEISLVPEATGEVGPEDQLIDSDTFAGAPQADVLEETGGDSGPMDDLMIETKAPSADEASLEEIEEDVNLDTFGSGSGLLDLSLQADDTSLGGILDEIYTSESGQETSEGPALDEVAQAQPILAEQDDQLIEPEPVAEVPVMAQAYIASPDTVTNVLGWMMFLPLLALVYTAVVSIPGSSGTMPNIPGQGDNGPLGIHIIWWAMFAVALVSCSIFGLAYMLSASSAKAAGKPKVKKAPKPKKAKKPKKGKK